MKKLMLQIGLMLSLVVGLTVVSANAQALIRYKAVIPFDFNLNHKSYQAGNYFINILDLTTLTIKDAKGQVLIVKIVSKNDSSNIKRLLFNRYENQYFLASVSTLDFSIKLMKSKDEKMLAKNQTAQMEVGMIMMTKPNN